MAQASGALRPPAAQSVLSVAGLANCKTLNSTQCGLNLRFCCALGQPQLASCFAVALHSCGFLQLQVWPRRKSSQSKCQTLAAQHVRESKRKAAQHVTWSHHQSHV